MVVLKVLFILFNFRSRIVRANEHETPLSNEEGTYLIAFDMSGNIILYLTRTASIA